MKQDSVIFSKQALGALVAALFIVFTTAAVAGPFHDRHRMGNPLEKMLDHIDLTDQQEAEIETIMNKFPREKAHKRGFGMIREMALLDPEDPDYLEAAEAKAQKAASMMAEHIMTMAKIRQEVHAILTEQQKQELRETLERKMERMAKRMDAH